MTSAAAPAALEPCLHLLGNLALGGADVAYAICHTSQLVSNAVSLIDRKHTNKKLLVLYCTFHVDKVTPEFVWQRILNTYFWLLTQVEGIMAISDLRSSVSGFEAAAKAQEAARPAALRALCLLCQAGTHTARRLLAAGHPPCS